MRIERITASGRDRYTVTLESGAALEITDRELLRFGLRAGDLLDEQIWEQLRESLDDWRCGRTQNLFKPIPRSRFAEAIARLDAEQERLTDSTVIEEKNHA